MNHSHWSPERLSEWERIRARGMRHFVWSHGVLRWGGFMFFFSLALFQHAHFGNVFSTEGHFLLRILLAGFTWTFVGWLYGRSQWYRNERDYAAQRRPGADR
ncbi:hypothetical protein [Candidatus Methylocalor cossyra]|uniref:2TM domain-containing protein n=1 Tax=Candidatus Methylocalor cossyra TaxID=3108543 RepID=A0ABM9NGP7_9GAMM